MMRPHTLVAFSSLLALLRPASSHSRWSCPEPRSPETGIKRGPCGADENDFGGPDEAVVEIRPGPMRVAFEESIHHTGAPFRISLSGDGDDGEACVLLDHIPHNDCCRPSLRDPSTYTRYQITVNIPNIICERCSLHLSNPMTDKIGEDGSPSGIGCTDPGTCFSVYHSCTKPFRIVGDADNGAMLRSEYSCPSYLSINEDWPAVWVGDSGEDVSASIGGVYRRESSTWSSDDFTLTSAPEQYQKDAGLLCGDGAETGTIITNSPSEIPTNQPSEAPLKMPTKSPSAFPTQESSEAPIEIPTKSPSEIPTTEPSKAPMKMPTKSPSKTPTNEPSEAPIQVPTKSPSESPTNEPSETPTKTPTKSPSEIPTNEPSEAPVEIAAVNGIFHARTAPPSIQVNLSTGQPIINKSPIEIPVKEPGEDPLETPAMNGIFAAAPSNQFKLSTGQPTTRFTGEPTITPIRSSSPLTRAVDSMIKLPQTSSAAWFGVKSWKIGFASMLCIATQFPN